MAVSDIFNTLTFATSVCLVLIAVQLLEEVYLAYRYPEDFKVSLSFVIAFASVTSLYSWAAYIVPTFYPRGSLHRRTRGYALAFIVVFGLVSMINYTIQWHKVSEYLSGDLDPYDKVYSRFKAVFDSEVKPPENSAPGVDFQKLALMNVLWQTGIDAKAARWAKYREQVLQWHAFVIYVAGWLLSAFLVIDMLFIIVPAKFVARFMPISFVVTMANGDGPRALPEDDSADSPFAALFSDKQE